MSSRRSYSSVRTVPRQLRLKLPDDRKRLDDKIYVRQEVPGRWTFAMRGGAILELSEEIINLDYKSNRYNNRAPGKKVLVPQVSWVGPPIEAPKGTRLGRGGAGTALYEAAARFACDKLGKPLHSDIMRSKFSQNFWEKQEAKGRAVCVRRCSTDEIKNTPYMDRPETCRGGCVMYRLKRCQREPYYLAGPVRSARTQGKGRKKSKTRL